MIQTVKHLPIALAALLCLGAAEPDWEAIYLKRFENARTGVAGGLELKTYDPEEPLVGAAHPAPLPHAYPSEVSISADALADAAAYAAERNSTALLIWRKGALQSASYFGKAQRDDLVIARSLAKPLAAIAVGRALTLGKLTSLDQPASDFITEWRSTAKAAITIRQLLSMTSGLLAQGASNDPQNIWSRSYLHPRHDKVLIEDYPLAHPPGSRFDYANAPYELIAVILERATGQRYGAFVGKEILAPIGAAGGFIWVNHPGGVAHSGCCSRLPAETWLRLAVLLAGDGVWQGKRLLPEGFVDAMRQPSAQNPWFGLGVFVPGPYTERRKFTNPDVPRPGVLHSAPYSDRDLFLFDGNGNQVAYILPSQRMVILRLGTAPPKDKEWDNSYLPNRLIAGLRAMPGEPKPTPQDAAR